MRSQQIFNTLSAAEEFLDSIAESEQNDTDSIVNNGDGTFTARYGRVEAVSELAELNRVYEKRQAEIDARHMCEMSRWAHQAVGSKIAADLSLEEADTFWFVEGFMGVPAKVANPRAAGKFEVFARGKSQRADKTAQRAVRAETARLYYNVPKEERVHYISAGPQANGEH